MWEDRSRAGMLHQHQLLPVPGRAPELGVRASSGPTELIPQLTISYPCQGSRLSQDKVLKSPSGADPAHQQQVRGRQGGFLWRKAAGAFAMPLIFSTRGMEVLKEKKQDKKTTLEYTAGSSGGNICPSAHTQRTSQGQLCLPQEHPREAAFSLCTQQTSRSHSRARLRKG